MDERIICKRLNNTCHKTSNTHLNLLLEDISSHFDVKQLKRLIHSCTSYIGLAASKGSQFLRCKLESVLYYYTDTQTRHNFSLLVNSKHVHEQPGATTEIVKRVILNGEA